MYREEDPTIDLKNEILQLKKQVTQTKKDNQLLKVNAQKLHNEISKRDRQIESLLNPKKSANFKKIMSERGATMILSLKDQNDQLQKTINEKETIIRRLQNDLQIAKLYVKPADRIRRGVTNFKQTEINCNKIQIDIPYQHGIENKFHSTSNIIQEDTTNKLQLRSTSATPNLQTRELSGSYEIEVSDTSPCPSSQASDLEKFTNNLEKIKNGHQDFKAQFEGLPRDHLLSIIETLKTNQRGSPRLRPHHRKRCSPESDLERTELLCDTPHEEIQHLQNYFLEMLTEIDDLKSILSQMQSEQLKSSNVVTTQGSINEKLDKILSMNRAKSKSPTKRLSRTKTRRPKSTNNLLNMKARNTKTAKEVCLTTNREESPKQKPNKVKPSSAAAQNVDIHNTTGETGDQENLDCYFNAADQKTHIEVDNIKEKLVARDREKRTEVYQSLLQEALVQ